MTFTLLSNETIEMKLIQDKYHLIVSGLKHENVCTNVGKAKIWGCLKQKLLNKETS